LKPKRLTLRIFLIRILEKLRLRGLDPQEMVAVLAAVRLECVEAMESGDTYFFSMDESVAW